MLTLIDKYYADNEVLRDLLVKHSSAVAAKALAIARKHPEWQLDLRFIEEAAMLHDIGIYLTDAPGIHCHGTEPYINHGRLGAELLRREGFPKHARVAERHTGAGLPGYLPETIEEKLICYADKFYSKSHPDREKTLDEARRSLQKFGEETAARFEALVNLFDDL